MRGVPVFVHACMHVYERMSCVYAYARARPAACVALRCIAIWCGVWHVYVRARAHALGDGHAALWLSVGCAACFETVDLAPWLLEPGQNTNLRSLA